MNGQIKKVTSWPDYRIVHPHNSGLLTGVFLDRNWRITRTRFLAFPDADHLHTDIVNDKGKGDNDHEKKKEKCTILSNLSRQGCMGG